MTTIYTVIFNDMVRLFDNYADGFKCYLAHAEQGDKTLFFNTIYDKNGDKVDGIIFNQNY